MTEADWLASDHRRLMLEWLGPRATDRKLRLLAVACTRRTTSLWPDSQPLAALEAAEQLADGFEPDEEVCREWRNADGSRAYFSYSAVAATLAPPAGDASYCACCRANASLGRAASAPFPHPTRFRVYMETVRREGAAQADLLRDIFGNPFRPVAFDPSWRTSDAAALALAMYESRDFGSMQILSDALQDAGCEEQEVSNHCRSGGVHVRGCWVVDLVLGKE